MSRDPNKLAYRIDEAAAAIGIGRTKLYEKIQEGRIATFKFCGRTLIRRDELERVIDEVSGSRAA